MALETRMQQLFSMLQASVLSSPEPPDKSQYCTKPVRPLFVGPGSVVFGRGLITVSLVEGED